MDWLSFWLFLAYCCSVRVFSWRLFASKRVACVISIPALCSHAMPVYWLATCWLFYLHPTPTGMDWLPSIGVQYGYASASFADRFIHSLGQLVIPVFTLVLDSLAYLTGRWRNRLNNSSQRLIWLLLRFGECPEENVSGNTYCLMRCFPYHYTDRHLASRRHCRFCNL